MVRNVSSQWLCHQITTAKSNLLLLDARSGDLFGSCCISGAVSVFCSGTIILRRLKKGNARIESLLNDESKEQYVRAVVSEEVAVIVYDEQSLNSEDLSSDSLAAILLKKLTRECRNVCFLADGFQHFQDSYPHLCEGDSCKDRSRPSSLVLQLNSLAVASDSDASQSPDSDGSEPSTPAHRGRQPFEILPYLYLGCRRIAANVETLKESGVSRILNVTSEPRENQHLEEFTYQQISVEDSHEVNMLQHLPRAFAFIEDARECGEKVLVHCHAGMSRSVTIIIAYLMKYHQHTLNSAYDHVRMQKSNISPNLSFLQQLLEFESSLRPSPADSGLGSGMTTPVEGHCSMFTVPPSLTPPLSRCVLAT